MADLFAKHPNTVKDIVVAETVCPLHQEPVKVSFELNGVRGKLTVLEECSILHMGGKMQRGLQEKPRNSKRHPSKDGGV